MKITAGGVILRGKLVAIILPSGVAKKEGWSWPKGHQDEDETLKKTAIREIEEETGFSGKILAYLGKWNDKSTERHYFLLEYKETVGKPDWEIDQVKWVTFKRAEVLFQKSTTTKREVWVLKKARIAAKELKLL